MNSKMKNRRIKMWMSLVDVAKLTGASPSTLWQIENGDHACSKERAEEIAKALRCNARTLFKSVVTTTYRARESR